MAIHIKELEINAYRGIKKLSFPSMNHVNIILGNNNVGKTSILEVLKSIQNPSSILNWRTVFRSDYRNLSTIFDNMIGLFPIDQDNLILDYEFKDEDNNITHIRIEGEIELVQIQEREIQRINGFISTGSKKDRQLDEVVDAYCLHIKIFVNNEAIGNKDIYDFSRRYRTEKVDKEYYPTSIMGPIDHILWHDDLSNVLNSTELHNKLIEALRIFDKDIVGIQSIQEKYEIKYYLNSLRYDKGIPLNLFGDGIKKALGLLSRIVFVENGLLMIDEFETSVHATALKDLFKTVLTIAQELNVQLFMTTHSIEAVEMILGLDGYPIENISVHTINKDESGNMVRTMGAKEAEKAIRMWGMDIRQ